MVMAQLRGKVPSDTWVGVEDMLTGMVLGSLKNLHPALTVDLLSRAQPLEGEAALRLSDDLTWVFWPQWDECEPDAVVMDSGNVCVIEVKLFADFGGGDVDERQLAREWRDGDRRAKATGKEFWLVSLTSHGMLPRQAILHQLEGADACLNRILWLSWMDVGRAIKQAPDSWVGGWRKDLLEVLSRMGLAPFDGFVQVVAGFDAAGLDGLPWVARPVVPLEPGRPVGFAEMVGALNALDYSRFTGWQPRLRSSSTRPGFSETIRSVIQLAEGGYPKWQLKLR